MLSNYEVAVRAEMKKVERRFVSLESLGVRALSLNPRHSRRLMKLGGFYRYIHPNKPSVWFETRKTAAVAGLEAA